jgi:hypothetical protein
MLPHTVPEADWKTFRKLREVALERFCARILEEAGRAAASTAGSFHERYLELFRLLGQRNCEVARAFDDPKRARMIIQLTTIYSYGLLEPGEMERFTEDTRGRVLNRGEA